MNLSLQGLIFLLLSVKNVHRTFQQEEPFNQRSNNSDRANLTYLLTRARDGRRLFPPPLPSDTRIDSNPGQQPQNDTPSAPGTVAAPPNIPLPNHPTPPPFPLRPDILIPERPSLNTQYNSFCDENPAQPLPKPHSCPTCRGQCGSTLCPNIFCSPVTYCSCDHLCLLFNDCCTEFSTNCPTEFNKGLLVLNKARRFRNMMNCTTVRTFNPNSSPGVRKLFETPMVVRCSNGSMCPKADPEWNLQSNLNDFIPVMDLDTGVQFASFQCAKCNGVRNIQPWDIRLDLIQLDNFVRETGRDFSKETVLKYQQDWDLILDRRNNQNIPISIVAVHLPADLSLRQCPIFPVTDTCSSSCSDNTDLVELCANSSTIYTGIPHKPDRAFRNYYCALCSWDISMLAFESLYNFEESIRCGWLNVGYPIRINTPTNIHLGVQVNFNVSTGLSLEVNITDYCLADETTVIPEPKGCPTCQNKCGNRITLYNSKSVEYCSCDYMCLFYNDCCDRFAIYCPEDWERGISLVYELLTYELTPNCFPTRVNKINIESQMITTCPDGRTCTDMTNYNSPRRWFLRSNVEEYVPVTHLATGINFASLKCARCHNISDVALWHVTVNYFSYQLSGFNLTNKTTLDLETEYPILKNISVNGVLNFEPPSGTHVRHCHHGYGGTSRWINIINSCPDSCHNDQLRYLCEYGNTMYTATEWEATYRNYYCALCSWDYKTMLQYGTELEDNIHCGAVGKTSGSGFHVGLISLSLVFDFDIRQGNQVGKNENRNSEDTDDDDELLDTLGLITVICIAISIICLLIRIGLQCCVPHFWSWAGKMQLQLTVALLITFVFLLLGALAEDYHALCYLCSVVKNFGFLASFSWMNAISYITAVVFATDPLKRKSVTDKKSLPKISVLAWLIPLILTTFTVIMDYTITDDSFTPSFAQHLCWYNHRYALLIYFGIPVALSIITNIILFTTTAISLQKAFQNSKAVSKQEQKNFQVYIRLFILMGITWILGFIAPFLDNIVVQSIFIILNVLQGLFLFLAFVCHRRVWDQLMLKSQRYGSSPTHTITGTTAATKQKTTRDRTRDDAN